MRGFSSRSATWWLMCSEPLSAWKPLIVKGKPSSVALITGTR